MNERTGVLTAHGNPLTLLGNEIKAGDDAPDFTVLDGDMKPVSLSSFKGRVVLLSTVPSLDTPVCDVETRRFNKEATGLGENVTILTVSMDLPFTQKRWCGGAGIDKVRVYSDHRDVSAGIAFGVLIKELRLLARAVFAIDRGGVVRFAHIVPELTHEPDYDLVLDAVRKIV